MSYSLTEVITTLGGLSVLITGVSVFIGKLLIEQAKAKFQIELEKTKNSFQSQLSLTRQYNDISKETYQKLFDEKISTYQKLNDTLQKYYTWVYERYERQFSPRGTYNSHDEAFMNLTYDVKKLIKKNQILISDELSEKYKDIYQKQSSFFLQHSIMTADPDSADPLDYDKMLSTLRNDTEGNMMELIEIVEKDISNLRKYLSGY